MRYILYDNFPDIEYRIFIANNKIMEDVKDLIALIRWED